MGWIGDFRLYLFGLQSMRLRVETVQRGARPARESRPPTSKSLLSPPETKANYLSIHIYIYVYLCGCMYVYVCVCLQLYVRVET